MKFSRLFRFFRSKSDPPDDEAPHLLLGKLGEKAALNHLKYEGYRIRALNYRTKRGEIDIIAQDNNVIAFVEVRTLSSEDHGDALSTITHGKRSRLTRAANHYIEKYKLREMEWRFDFISVKIGSDKIPRLKLIRNAFPPA